MLPSSTFLIGPTTGPGAHPYSPKLKILIGPTMGPRGPHMSPNRNSHRHTTLLGRPCIRNELLSSIIISSFHKPVQMEKSRCLIWTEQTNYLGVRLFPSGIGNLIEAIPQIEGELDSNSLCQNRPVLHPTLRMSNIVFFNSIAAGRQLHGIYVLIR